MYEKPRFRLEKKVLAENGMQSEIRENAVALLYDRPPFIISMRKVDFLLCLSV